MNTQLELFIQFLVVCCVGFLISIVLYNIFDDKYFLERIKNRFKK